MENVQYVGVYGNSNPQYILDWVEVEKKIYSQNALSAYCPDTTLMFL
jgi:hypothetical protein